MKDGRPPGVAWRLSTSTRAAAAGGADPAAAPRGAGKAIRTPGGGPGPQAVPPPRGLLPGARQGRLGLALVQVELVVEGDGGVDQGQVGERLGEVAELLPGRPDLPGSQAAVGAVGLRLLERKHGLVA